MSNLDGIDALITMLVAQQTTLHNECVGLSSRLEESDNRRMTLRDLRRRIDRDYQKLITLVQEIEREADHE